MSPNSFDPLAWLDDELARLDEQGLRRQRLTVTRRSPARLAIDGRELIDFSSNDYLGLACDPRCAGAASDAADRAGWGAGASPLITGRSDLHQQLEQRLAEFEGVEAAILFPSGYAANLGTIGALVGAGDIVFSDEKNHASIIDGCRLSRARVAVYRHADCDHLATLLREAGGHRRRMIVTDSLFSMDGDLAPLVQLAELADEHRAMLMIDEAHATGVFGELGRGVAEHLGVESRIDVRVGTLSKALGCAGGFVAGHRALVDWLANRARPYVFSTAGPPAGSAAALAALDVVQGEASRRRELLQRAAALRQRLRIQGWNTGASESQIIPVIVGDAGAAISLAAELRRRGIFVPAIRPPSVAPGTARLRIGLTAAHTSALIDELAAALAELAPLYASVTAR